MPEFARGTKVSVTGSIDEIKRTVRRFGATEFQYGESDTYGVVAFSAADRKVRFTLAMPDRNAPRFMEAKVNQHAGTQRRSHDQAQALWEQACAEKWRALSAVVKAKLVAVEVGISTFEEEFLAHVVMPDGRTVYEQAKDTIALGYSQGTVRPLLTHVP